MKNKKPLIFIFAIAGLLGLITTGVVFFSTGKFQKIAQESTPLIGSAPYKDTGISRPSYGGTQNTQQQDYLALPESSQGSTQKYIAPIPPTTGGGDALHVDERVYQKSGYYTLVVDNTADYLRQIKEYILSIDGRVLNTNVNTTERYQYGVLTAKVPVAKFEETTQRVTSNVKKIINERVNAQDKTGQQQTLEDQLESLEEQKLDLQIQLEEADTDLEKKRLELQIKRIENQIQEARQNLNSFAEKVEYSAVSITAADSEAYFNPDTYQPSLREQAKIAWQSVSEILYVFGYVLVWLAVYSIIWLPLITILWLLTRKASKKKAQKSEQSTEA